MSSTPSPKTKASSSRSAAAAVAQPEIGPAGYENWRASFFAELPNAVFEIQLYSDAYLTGQIADECRPYGFFNALPFDAIGHYAHVATLRVEAWDSPRLADLSKTDMSRYHGGWLSDELSALASLLMGIRLKSGGISRRFEVGDTCGRPYADTQAPPSPLPPRQRNWIIPRARESQNINAALVPRLVGYPILSRAEAITLVRAARLYQDAIWIAEAEPELAWLLLVSAVEVVATHNQVATFSASDTLALAIPALHAELLEAGGDDLVSKCAAHLERHLRATARFQAFFERYSPPPPPRPADKNVFEFEWQPAALKKALAKIYDYRSRALHDGTPFPAPMCEAPAQAGFHLERPLGLATGTNDAAWLAADTPMLLHVFEHVARSAILQWWDDRVAEAERLVNKAWPL